MKKHITIFFITVIGGIFTSFLFARVGGGFSLISGWRGMRFLDRMGWPFSWRTECPNSIEPIPAPTGCMNGFNPTALGLNIIFFTITLFLLIELILFFRKKYLR